MPLYSLYFTKWCLNNRISTYKRIRLDRCWQGCGETEHSYTICGNESGTATLENNMAFLKRLNNELPFDPVIPKYVYSGEVKMSIVKYACDCS